MSAHFFKVSLLIFLGAVMAVGATARADEFSLEAETALGMRLRQGYETMTGQKLGVLTSSSCQRVDVAALDCRFAYDPQMLPENAGFRYAFSYVLNARVSYLDGIMGESVQSFVLTTPARD